MRDKILAILEKNARIDIHELAALLGRDETLRRIKIGIEKLEA